MAGQIAQSAKAYPPAKRIRTKVNDTAFGCRRRDADGCDRDGRAPLCFAEDSGPEAFKGESKALGRADYFPFKRAAAYWRFIRAMNSRLISFGQTASQEPVTVQLPNPSASID